MSKVVVLSAVFVLAVTSISWAQLAPFPGGVRVGPAWVPCSHPLAHEAGLGCGPTPIPEPAPGDPPDTAPIVTYTPGRVYVQPYPHTRMVVLAVVLDTNAVPHVVCQWLSAGPQHAIGDVFTFPAGDHQPWTLASLTP